MVNQIVEAYLHCFCGERPKERTLRLQLVEYGYNTTYQISIGITPFQAIYGHLPPPLLYYGESTTVNTTLDQQSRERDDALQVLKEHLQVAQDQMKKFPDKKRREVEFQVDDLVFLKLQHIDSQTLRPTRNEKPLEFPKIFWIISSIM